VVALISGQITRLQPILVVDVGAGALRNVPALEPVGGATYQRTAPETRSDAP
jgi:hypothetical protein